MIQHHIQMIGYLAGHLAINKIDLTKIFFKPERPANFSRPRINKMRINDNIVPFFMHIALNEICNTQFVRQLCKTFFGVQTGDMVRAVLPSGKFAGTHVGRLAVRESGVFDLRTGLGKISPVRHKYCKTVHRNDGYMYAFSTFVQ